MKLSIAKKIHYDSGPNMVPLVDVSLVILIFMMLAGSFGMGEHYLHSDLPAPYSASGAANALDEPLIVRLSPADDHSFSAQFLGQHVDSLQALQSGMQAVHDRLDKAVKGSAQKTLVLLAPSQSVPYQQAIAAYETIRKAGFTRISFSSR
jgi:biopolymer transport protein ExbD